MVLVTVGDDDSSYLLNILLHVGKIGDNKVNAGHIAVGKCKTAVNYEDIVSALKEGHILAYFVKTAQRDYFKGSALNGSVIRLVNGMLYRCFSGIGVSFGRLVVACGLIVGASSVIVIILYIRASSSHRLIKALIRGVAALISYSTIFRGTCIIVSVVVIFVVWSAVISPAIAV